ncbi:MAG: hypothetical protein A3F16_01310 [Deltaproteobacteria bacterium RIFCSPHIGHO2_12_FULL_43_9]|nr:MAG: hypothetical protein A3F16_01310 [Deltaproteobacteria bacterium RIFCSPHIGHO2_12_FULL_43_9]
MKRAHDIFYRNNKGAVLIITVIVALFVATLGLTLITWRYFEGKDVTFIMRESQVLALAETGVRDTIYHLTAIDPEWLGDTPVDHPLKVDSEVVGVYRVNIVDLGDNDRQIQVTAYIPDATNPHITKTLHVQGTLTGPSSDEVNSIFLYGIYDGGGSGVPFVFDGDYTSFPIQTNTLPGATNKQVRGSVHSNTGFAFRNGSATVVDGTVYTSAADVEVTNWSGNYSTAGPAVTGQNVIENPELDADAEAALLANAEVVYLSTTSLTGMIDLGDHLTDDGDIFIDGDLSIDAVIKGKGYIVATGNVYIVGSIVGLSTGAVTNIVAFNNIEYNLSSNIVVMGGMYAGNQYRIMTTGAFNMTRGSIAAANGFVVDPGANVTISWDPKLGDPAENPNALGFAMGVGAGGVGGGSIFDLSGGGYWYEVD